MFIFSAACTYIVHVNSATARSSGVMRFKFIDPIIFANFRSGHAS